jgi:hypothetical protein
MRKRTATVYWLIPAEPERELFSEIIRILAKQFDAPRFEPHVTIFTAPQDRQPRKTLRQLATTPIRLKIRDISFSRKFTKTLFVRFKSSAGLEKVILDLARATKSRAKPSINPHLSLLYKKVDVSTKRELAATIKLPFREVIFDSIKAMRCISPTTTPAEVKAWRVLATKSLR